MLLCGGALAHDAPRRAPPSADEPTRRAEERLVSGRAGAVEGATVTRDQVSRLTRRAAPTRAARF